MHPGVWIRYLLGQGSAIREVAESRSALWTGIGLVLLTAIARNYDQTFIGEKPFLWLFGSLLFSLVSGTWLYVIVYGCFARWRMDRRPEGKPGFWSGWRGFMGLFWMTAPIAWLYAIPVERFCDPVAAAKANVFLLATVSLWRVLLMTRVVQHLTTAPAFIVLFWVGFAAAMEVLVVFFFGGAFARAIMSGMGGMRNSPAEDILLDAMGAAFVGSLWTAPIAFAVSLAVRTERPTQPLPTPTAAPLRTSSLALAAVFWISISVVPQIQLARNVAVEKLLAEGKSRAALDYLSGHQPNQFAPARTLPPKPFEYSVFEELPACFDAIQTSHAMWVREFLMQRLNETMIHYAPRWDLAPESPGQKVKRVQNGLARYHQKADGLLKLLNGLTRIPEGQTWLATNRLFLQAMQQVASEAAARSNANAQGQPTTDWLSLSNRLQGMLLEVSPSPAANRSADPAPALR